MKIVLISGKAESGKDTAAKMILEKVNGKRIGIGDYIKIFAREYLEWNGEKDKKGRTLLQELGDKGRGIHSSFWLEFLKKTISLMEKIGEEVIIIPDLRLRKELIWFLANFPIGDVISLRVTRIGHENSLTEEQRNHITEIDLDDENFDYRICARNIEQLEDGVDRFIHAFRLNKGGI